MTVTELAKLTGYSISTVSKALSDSSEISGEAKEKILSAAKRTGYYEKAVRRKKRIGMPQTVGIVTDDIRDSAVYRLTRALKERGISPVVCDAQNALFVLCDALSVDAIILANGKETECNIPFAVYRSSADSTADEIEALLSGKELTSATQKKKEDIWLF